MMLRRSLSPLWFVIPLLAVYSAALAIVQALPRVEAPRVAAFALTFDLVFIVPALYYVVLIRGRGWRPITLAPVFLVSFAAASLIIPDNHHSLLDAIGLALPVIEMVVLGYVGYRAFILIREGRAMPEGDLYDRMRHIFGRTLDAPVVAGMLAYEISLFRYAFAIRRPALPEIGLAYHRKSGYGPILAAVMIVAVGELVGIHILLLLWSKTAATIHLGLSAYGLMWLVGDYRAMRRRPHIVDEVGMHVRCGLRWDLTFPWRDVCAVRKAVRAEEKGEYVSTAPIGKPTYVVELHTNVEAVGVYGITKRVRRVGLIVDDRETFERRLREYGVTVE